MTRTRSEYRMSPITVSAAPTAIEVTHPIDAQREALAVLMLDGYRSTIDDEGEDLDDALAAIDHYLDRILRPHSFIVLDGAAIVAFSFVVSVEDVHYIDPVVVASTSKQRGLGAAAVGRCLQSLADAGVSEVGATITDGNTASERLFLGLGFVRHGSWS